MPSTPTPRLRVMQQARGENINAWGDPNLNNALARLEEGQAKVLTLTITGDKVLSVQNYLEDEARSAVLVLTGTPSAAFKITIPPVEKPYLVANLTGQICTIGSAAGALATVRSGITSTVFCNGTDTQAIDLSLDQIRKAIAPVDLNGQRLTNLGAAVSGSDAATRQQVTDLTAANVTLASDWAKKLSATVDGSEYSSKEYAVGATTPLGSAKAWATSTAVVASGLKGARGYANDASSSATSASGSASTATTAAGTATDKLADFNNRYVVAGSFPATGNFAGRLAFNTTGNQFGVYNASTGNYDVLTIPGQATETQLGIVQLATQAIAEAGTENTRPLTALRTAQAIAKLSVPPKFETALFHARDEKTAGAVGGDAVSGFQTRTLNTILTNEIGAALSSSVITLPAGTYYAEGSAPAFSMTSHKARLFNVTDSTVLLLGTNENGVTSVQTRSTLSGRFTLSASKQIRLEHYTDSARTNGLGGGGSSPAGSSTFSELKIWKVA